MFAKAKFDGVILDLIYAPSKIEPPGENYVAGFHLWDALDKELRQKRIKLRSRCGHVVVSSAVDPQKDLVQRRLAEFRKKVAACSVCFSGVMEDRENICRKAFGIKRANERPMDIKKPI